MNLLLFALLLVVLAGCEAQSRRNAFVEPIYGRPGPQSPAVAALDEPFPSDRDVSVERAPGASPATGARRSGPSSSFIRRPSEPEEASSISLRKPIRIGAGGNVTMNFDRITVPEFARAVFGEILGLDFAIAPDVAGVVSLQVNEPVPRDVVYPIAVSTLETVGVTVRRDGDFLVIEPEQQEPGASVAPSTVVFRKLKFVGRDDMQQALQPFLSSDANVSPGPTPGMLLLSGSESGVYALLGIVEALDINPLSDKSFGLFPLARAGAAEVAAELRSIMTASGVESFDVVEIQRMNAVLVVSNSDTALREALFWAEQLDQNAVPGKQLYVYQVQNRRAVDLAELLQQSVASGKAARTRDTETVAPGLTPVSVEDSEAPAEAAVSAFPAVQSASAANLDIEIFADEGTNSLMILASPDDYRIVSSALRRLDIQPVQVLIEATVVEVALTDDLRYGVRWFFENGDVSFGFTDSAVGLVAPSFPGFNFVLDASDARVVVSALDEVTDVQIVSSPSLMVLNNETARLNVGDNVGIPTRQSQGTTDDARVVSEFERVDTGVILEITPRVNASGLVLLDVVQEVSEVVPGSSSNNLTISQRTVQSSVLVRDRETLALGGLIRNRLSKGKSGIPLLSDIPVVGAAFGTTDLSDTRTELLILMRPIVVRNHFEARSAYFELKEKLPGLNRFDTQNSRQSN